MVIVPYFLKYWITFLSQGESKKFYFVLTRVRVRVKIRVRVRVRVRVKFG